MNDMKSQLSFSLKETITDSDTGSYPHVVIPNKFNLSILFS